MGQIDLLISVHLSPNLLSSQFKIKIFPHFQLLKTRSKGSFWTPLTLTSADSISSTFNFSALPLLPSWSQDQVLPDHLLSGYLCSLPASLLASAGPYLSIVNMAVRDHVSFKCLNEGKGIIHYGLSDSIKFG